MLRASLPDHAVPCLATPGLTMPCAERPERSTLPPAFQRKRYTPRQPGAGGRRGHRRGVRMERESRRLARLGVAATIALTGAGVVATSATREARAVGWLMVIAGLGLILGTYIQDWLAARKEGRPALPRGYELLSYKNLPYKLDPRTPFMAAMQFRSLKTRQPARLEIICSELIQSAAATMEETRDRKLIEGWGFSPTVTGNRAYFGFSRPATEPRFVFFVEVRSSVPVRILRVLAVKDGPLEDSPADLVALTTLPPDWPHAWVSRGRPSSPW